MGVPFVPDICAEKNLCSDTVCQDEFCDLAKGYKEMSRINLSLAEENLALDNEALSLSEQKLAECE